MRTPQWFRIGQSIFALIAERRQPQSPPHNAMFCRPSSFTILFSELPMDDGGATNGGVVIAQEIASICSYLQIEQGTLYAPMWRPGSHLRQGGPTRRTSSTSRGVG